MKEGLLPTQKGDIIERLIADLIVLSSNGELTTYIPISDLEGIDLIVKERHCFEPIYIQVKGRFKLEKENLFNTNVRKSSLTVHQRLYFILALFDNSTLGLHDPLWLIPSERISQLPISQGKHGPRYKCNADIRANSRDELSQFKVRKEDLATELKKVIARFH